MIFEGCLLIAFPVEANVTVKETELTCPKVAEAEQMMVSQSPSVKDGGEGGKGKGEVAQIGGGAKGHRR